MDTEENKKDEQNLELIKEEKEEQTTQVDRKSPYNKDFTYYW